MQKYIYPLVGALVLIVGLLGGWYVTQEQKAPEKITYVLESVQDKTYTGDQPDLDHEPEFGASVPDEIRETLHSKIDVTTKQLRRYAYDGNAWMELALHYHQGNDFKAAEKIWLFVVDVAPTNVTAFANLGRLYHFEYKDFPKAEAYFKKAIEANPDRTEAYFELFDLYRYSYKKDTTAAVDIMKVGAERFPDDVNFPAGLGVYYRDSGRPNQARVQFEKALTMARTAGDMNLIQTYTTELSRL